MSLRGSVPMVVCSSASSRGGLPGRCVAPGVTCIISLDMTFNGLNAQHPSLRPTRVMMSCAPVRQSKAVTLMLVIEGCISSASDTKHKY
jgi:hypothetical protein